jgi:hypothetical protein
MPVPILLSVAKSVAAERREVQTLITPEKLWACDAGIAGASESIAIGLEIEVSRDEIASRQQFDCGGYVVCVAALRADAIRPRGEPGPSDGSDPGDVDAGGVSAV